MADNINIARNIAALRKGQGLTQDDLAEYLGVTKASVSKWETGQSCPDIALLPKISTYFGISIDELMGYEPQMTKAGIREACARLREAFAEKPFGEALDDCRALTRDYYACYPLLVEVAYVYLNHMSLAPDADASKAVEREIVRLCQRVREGSKSSWDIRQADVVDAFLSLHRGEAAEVAALLSESWKPDLGEFQLLAQAHQMLGERDKAEETLQVAAYQALVTCINSMGQMAALRAGEPQRLDILRGRFEALVGALDLERLHPNVAMAHLAFAQAFVMAGNVGRALDCVEAYGRACRLIDFEVPLHGDALFDHLDGWIAEQGMGQGYPRNASITKQAMVDAVEKNPVLALLAPDERFGRVLNELKEIAS